MSFEKTPATNDYWAAFTSATGKVADDYVVVAFGHTKEMADELVALVLAGTKRATTSLLLEYAPGVESMPRVGDFVVVVDGKGNPRCIWCTTEIVVKPLIEVDDTFAWAESEGTALATDGYRLTGNTSPPRRNARDSRCMTRSKPCSSDSKSSGRRRLPI